MCSCILRSLHPNVSINVKITVTISDTEYCKMLAPTKKATRIPYRRPHSGLIANLTLPGSNTSKKLQNERFRDPCILEFLNKIVRSQKSNHWKKPCKGTDYLEYVYFTHEHNVSVQEASKKV